MIEQARAKLNLALHVTGRRADGYHLLDSLVAFAETGDRVSLQPGPLSLSLDGQFAPDLDTCDDNLCLRAARLIGGRASIRLTKNLPVASGIGGGSADAAAVLRAFSRQGLCMPENPEQLGADVPVCLAGHPARMRGIGDVLDPVPPIPPLPLVLVNPGMALSTPQVFGGLARRDNPNLTPPDWTDAEGLLIYLSTCRNDLQASAQALVPQIGAVLGALRAGGARLARMSGSGATCFGLFDSSAAAASAAIDLTRRGWWAVASELAQPATPR